MAITFPTIPNISNSNIKTPTNVNSSIKLPNTPQIPSAVDALKTNIGGSSSKNSISLNAGLDMYGWKIPFIMINRFFIDRDNIAQFSIFNDEFLPRVKMKLSYKNTYFLYLYLPRKGDRINFLLKSETSSFYDIDEQKTEIRCDFIINSVKVSSHEYGHMSEDNQDISIDIEGQMFIPKLFTKVSKVWEDKTSKDTLEEICKDLDIGYKTNFDETKDKMNWICPMDTYYSMIQYIVEHAWIDDDSFFHAYIDLFYNLNFINVNDVLDEKTTKEEEKNMVVENTDFLDFYKRSEELNIQHKVLITNFPTARNTNYFIQNVGFSNRLDTATIFNGEGRGIMWYNSDGTDTEYKDTVIKSQELKEPFYTNDYDDLNAKVLDPVYEQNFAGLEYQLPKHNVHKNYKKSEWNNFQKLQDFHLFEINCKLRMFNHVIQRSNHLFVLLITTEINTLMYLDEYNTFVDNTQTQPEAKIDKVMSGAYYIRGINFHWFNGHTDFSQEVLCFRKTKPIDPIKIIANKGSADVKEGGASASSSPDLPKPKTFPKVPDISKAASMLPFEVPKFTPPPLPSFFDLPGLALPSLPSLPNVSLPALPTIPGLDTALSGISALAATAQAAQLAAVAGALSPAGPALAAAAKAASAALAAAGAAASGVVSAATGAVSSAAGAASSALAAAGAAASSALSSATGALSSAAGAASSALSSATGALSSAAGAASSAVSSATGALSSAASAASSAAGAAASAASNISNTLQSTGTTVSDSLNSVASSIPSVPSNNPDSISNVQTLPDVSQPLDLNPPSSNFQNAV